MNIEKAIEILQEMLSRGSIPTFHGDDAALKLGTEALKRVQKYRPFYADLHPPLLPSETKD